MWHIRLKMHLASIVKWLRTGSDTQNQWELHIELAHGCLNAMSVLPTAKRIGIQAALDRIARHPGPELLKVVEPQIRAMALALEERDRRSALAYAETASRWL
jgi:hypothetical protein